ncbi:P-loop containing nucleoside triphosphate hydrolase protein [Coniochaeta ligniaria NRRL 30616]|uniref:DNA 3'-5' helicase n=1 Tax=Coniochaeta ligniaria NRRL 30616 TaxID=1408157 RepID=A0A1J7J6G7_9PEZI|nr:P-loop containing nucleoside triphosphate hydrolase protein [Coniochaeta ligniaria NRRL 30616]
MAGNWSWAPAQGQPTRSYHWPASQFSQPQPTQNVYEQDEFLPTAAHDGFNTYHAHVDPTSSLLRVQSHDDDGLDEFDRQLLGMTELPAAHPQSARRLTLPQAQPTMRPVLQPAFENHAHGYPSNMFLPDHQQSGPGYSLVPQLARLPEPGPATTAIAPREPTQRYRELHPNLQQEASSLYSASYTYSQVEGPATPPPVRSSSDAGSLSPAAGASLRKQSRSHNLSQHGTPSMSSQHQPSANASSGLPRGPPVVHGIQLVSPRQALPENLLFQSIFPYSVFNAVQSKCFESVYCSSDNLVVSAPTGSGKTAILELAICKIVAERGPENIKIVYQAPTKALCGEKARDWSNKFKCLNLQCAELTGDTSQAQMQRVGSASIIVTTPEKWDSITRKWHDHRKLLQLVGLFLIDEVHILKDVRGATLEAVVSRMKAIGTNVRFVALSATVPNSEDIATWLGLNLQNQHLPALRETFGPQFRPVQLERHIFGYEKRTNDHVFDKYLDSKLPPLLAKYTCGKPILVFCFTRKSCESTATKLAQWWTSLPENEQRWHHPPNQIRVLSRELQELVKTGVAFHHAGLSLDDRQAIEQAFLKGELSVICCTSTLAVGVNLPCHTVVLKGTVTYQNDSIHELSDLEVMQMLGRAGRPQFDDSANALILTSSDQKERYDKMVSGKEILESTLHLNLIEHLNSEVGLRTITDMESAKKWLGGTFLSVRMRRNPDYYRLAEGTSAVKDTESMLEDICERGIKLLQEYDIITGEQVFKQTEYGSAMSRYMVEFNTMKLLLELPRAMSMEQLLSALSKANEFREFKFKPADGPIFREVNKSPFILYQIDENVTKTWHKISLIVQLHLGGADYPDSSESQKQRHQLRIEKKGIFERLQRLVRCVAECKGHDCDSVSTKTALELARSLAAGAWEGRPSELLQIPQIGPVNMRKLISQGVKTVKDLVHKNCGELEHLLSRKPPAGKMMSDKLKTFPLLGFDLAIPSRKYMSVSGDVVPVPVVATLRYFNQTGLPKWNDRVPSATFVAETTAGLLVYFWKGSLNKIKNDTGLELRFSADVTAVNQRIVCHFSCDEIVGTMVTKSLDHNIQASAFKARREQVEVTAEARPEQFDGEDLAKQAHFVQPTVGSLCQDDPDDADAVEAAAALLEHVDESRNVEDGSRKTHSQKTVESNYDTDGDFPMIEEILEAISPQLPSLPQAQSKGPGIAPSSGELMVQSDGADKDPIKLPNGKYQCNHACAGGALTKAGKQCTHRCCSEGLDKPRKLKPRAAETKKRKAEGSVDESSKNKSAVTSSSGSVKTSSSATKKGRLDQQSTSVLDTASTPWKPVFHPTNTSGTDAAHNTLMYDSELDCLDLSNVDDDGEALPDLAALASQKRKNKAPGSSRTNTAKAAASRMAGGQAKSLAGSLSSPAEDYMPSAPPATTTDYGELDDDFDDDLDFEFPDLLDQKFVEPSSTAAEHAPSFKKSPDTNGAFRSGAQDAMLFTGARLEPPPKTAESEHARPSLSPKSYKAALQEAARLCDIDSQLSSFHQDMGTPPPDNFDPFDEGLTSLTDKTTPADDNLAPRSPGAAPNGLSLESSFDARSPSSKAPAEQEKQESEPAWVQEFDQELIDSFRGYVNFV